MAEIKSAIVQNFLENLVNLHYPSNYLDLCLCPILKKSLPRRRYDSESILGSVFFFIFSVSAGNYLEKKLPHIHTGFHGFKNVFLSFENILNG